MSVDDFDRWASHLPSMADETDRRYKLAREAWLAAILADPIDDLARLAFADWLEEQSGHTEHLRAEFIRVQLALAHAGTVKPGGLALREENLLNTPCRCEGLPHLKQAECWLEGTPLLPPQVRWRRGFVAVVTLTLEEWRLLGPAIVRTCPVEEVILQDCEPEQLGIFWHWWKELCNPHCSESLPTWLFRHLPHTFSKVKSRRYLSHEDAHKSLSHAALKWARLQYDTNLSK